VQAWRGVPSHFNVATPFDAAVTRGLAGGGAVLVLVIVALTIAAFRVRPDVQPSLRIAIQAGFITLCTSMAVGGAMIARGMTFVFEGDAQTAYLTGGVWKPMHAVTMHAILLLPAMAWLLSFVNWSEAERVRVIRITVAAYAAFAVLITVANLTGLL
jgi:hypothetical protein